MAHAAESGTPPLTYDDWLQAIQGDLIYKGDKGDKGDPGVGVENAYVNSSKHLILVLTNGTIIDAGYVGQGEEGGEEVEVQEVAGMVVNADTREPIVDATIQLYADIEMTILVETVQSDVNGAYSIELPVGTYYIKITASGFISFDTVQVMTEGGTTYVESFIMVEGDDDTEQEGTIGGNIVNSVTGGIVADVRIIVREGWNNVEGDIVTEFTTNSNGDYEVTLPLGNYTVSIIKEGFVNTHINVVVTTAININYQGSIVPEGGSEIPSGDLRVVLTWGATPSDLDSHLIGPDGNGGRFHVYYLNKTHDGSIEKADLDLDDTDSYGPETTTIYNMEDEGIYSFYVHDYTNQSSTDSTMMSLSGAQVKVYVGNEIIATYNIPANTVGTLWHVFDFDAAQGRIIPVNQLTNHESASSVGSQN